jgi:hypothetical protein
MLPAAKAAHSEANVADAAALAGRPVWNVSATAAGGGVAEMLSACAPAWVPPERLWVIPPSISPLSPTNRPIAQAECRRILIQPGLLPADGAPPGTMPDGGQEGTHCW